MLCTATVSEEDKLVLECGHTMHASCFFRTGVDQWLQCPLCQAPISFDIARAMAGVQQSSSGVAAAAPGTATAAVGSAVGAVGDYTYAHLLPPGQTVPYLAIVPQHLMHAHQQQQQQPLLLQRSPTLSPKMGRRKLHWLVARGGRLTEAACARFFAAANSSSSSPHSIRHSSSPSRSSNSSCRRRCCSHPRDYSLFAVVFVVLVDEQAQNLVRLLFILVSLVMVFSKEEYMCCIYMTEVRCVVIAFGSGRIQCSSTVITNSNQP